MQQCGPLVAEDAALGQASSSSTFSWSPVSALSSVATRSAISIDLSGTYWLTFISPLWKVPLMLTIYWTAKIECSCQPWLERPGVTLSLPQGCTQKVWFHQKSGLKNWKWRLWVNAHDPATGDDTITSVFSDICLLEELAAVRSLNLHLQNTASILSKIRFSRPDHIPPLSAPCLRAHCSTWLVMCDDTVINSSHWRCLLTHTHTHSNKQTQTHTLINASFGCGFDDLKTKKEGADFQCYRW